MNTKTQREHVLALLRARPYYRSELKAALACTSNALRVTIYRLRNAGFDIICDRKPDGDARYTLQPVTKDT